jgi:hypothetical protein
MGPQRYAALKQRCRNCVRFQHVLPQTLALRPFPDTRRATGVFKVPSINPHVTTGQLAVIVERPLVGDTVPSEHFVSVVDFSAHGPATPPHSRRADARREYYPICNPEANSLRLVSPFAVSPQFYLLIITTLRSCMAFNIPSQVQYRSQGS